MRPATPSFNFSQQAGPSSPPETPTTSSFVFSKPAMENRRYGVQNFSRHLPAQNGSTAAHDKNAGLGFSHLVQPEDLSPRSSTPSSESSGSPPRSLSSEPRLPLSESPPRRHTLIVAEGNFTVEEFGESDYKDFDGDDEDVIRPHQYEDADSDHARPLKDSIDLDPYVLSGFRDLDCGNEDSQYDREAWQKERRAEKRRKRRSSGSKRTLTQSIGSDTDDEDLQPVQFDANEAGSSARRLRRKVDCSSLIFDDPPPGIPEVEEPESCEEVVDFEVMEVGQVVDRALPFYVQDMDVDWEHE